MTITVQLFARHAELLGTSSVTLDLADGATVDDALSALEKAHPRLSVERATLAVAVNLEYTNSRRVLRAGDELALIGPVSGG